MVPGLERLRVGYFGLIDIGRHGPLLVNGWIHNLWEVTPDRPVTFLSIYLQVIKR